MTTSATNPVRPRRRRWLFPAGVLLLGVLLLAGAGLLLYGGPRPPAPVAANPFLNTGPDARYVGSTACIACHAAEHTSFQHTGMGRSMAPVDLQREPPDAA